MTTSIPVAIIGAGQAGLAMSRCLTDRSIDHVLLERGEVAHSWRTERWDSLRLLTPNWMTRLPGHRYEGTDPNGFMPGEEVVNLLTGYGQSFAAPVHTNTTVESIHVRGDHHVITTDAGVYRARAVVIATGAASTPRIPALAAELPAHVHQIAPIHYRNPDQLDDGPVLVVGASASGAQLADELRRSGRDVMLAVGDHTRLPRTYRGMDIHWWMDTIGVLSERHDEVPDIARARRLPSLQLVGSPERRDLDLNALAAAGVELVGRFAGVSGSTAMFSGSLANLCASADLKLGRLLDRIDDVAAEHGLDAKHAPGDRPAPTHHPAPITTRDLRSISTVVWATGFRPTYPWLEPHLLDRKGAIRHTGGVMTEPGMYVLGLPFQQHRASSFIDGVGRDATELAAHLTSWLDAVSAPRTTTANPSTHQRAA
ncbi:MAG: NAD(P)-binding domain-containing protein [Actinomycetota bacterium]